MLYTALPDEFPLEAITVVKDIWLQKTVDKRRGLIALLNVIGYAGDQVLPDSTVFGAEAIFSDPNKVAAAFNNLESMNVGADPKEAGGALLTIILPLALNLLQKWLLK